MPFADQVVFVTGGGSSTGRLAARRMADAGARVAALDVHEAGLAETAEGRAGIHTWRLDVTDNDAVLATVKGVEDRPCRSAGSLIRSPLGFPLRAPPLPASTGSGHLGSGLSRRAGTRPRSPEVQLGPGTARDSRSW